jgi:hypothetical protein
MSIEANDTIGKDVALGMKARQLVQSTGSLEAARQADSAFHVYHWASFVIIS